LAPYELTLFSFLDADGKEQDFTTTDPAAAQAHASRHGLVILHNRYEFVTSEPLPDPKGNPQAAAGRRHPAPRRQAKQALSPESPTASGPTRAEVLALLARVYHQRIGHDLDCPCLHGGACLCLRSEIAQTLAAAGLQS
jgi:hypothetical protein